MVVFKHFTLSDRRAIEQGLRDGRSFSAIAKDLRCDPTGVAKEVKRHVTIRETGAYREFDTYREEAPSEASHRLIFLSN